MLLVAGVLASLATSEFEPRRIGWNETWVAENLFDGQTAVPRDHEIRLTIGYRDFVEFEGDEIDGDVRDRASAAFAQIAIYRLGYGSAQLSLDVQIHDESSIIGHAPFAENTSYVLDLNALEGYLRVDRVAPGPIHFSTTHGPQVTGVWRNDDTLIVSFSEPMDPETLWLSQLSVDLLWEEDDELHSIASDLNLTDFAWETDGYLFLFAPVDWSGTVWVKVDRGVRGLSGGPLDGNGNGVPDEDDDYVSEVNLLTLPVCFGREDIPAPCIDQNDVEFWGSLWRNGW